MRERGGKKGRADESKPPPASPPTSSRRLQHPGGIAHGAGIAHQGSPSPHEANEAALQHSQLPYLSGKEERAAESWAER